MTMLHRLTRGAVATAAVAVGVLTLGSGGGAWAATAPATGSPWTQAAQTVAGATVSGTVGAVLQSSFTLTVAGGPPVTVDVTPTTVFAETGAVTAPAGVATGEKVTVTPAPGPVTGPWHAHGAITAARVLVVLTHVIGTVQSVGAGSFTIQLVGGLVLPVTTTPTTAVRNNGVRQSGVYVGQFVTAYGAADPGDPSLLVAMFVVVTDPPPAAVAVGPGTEPLVTGTVASTQPGSFVLDEDGGAVVTVETPTTTTYGETGSPTAPAGVSTGERVRVTPVGDGPVSVSPLTAARVVVVLTQVTGVVTSVAPGSFTVQLFGGLVVTVDSAGASVFDPDGGPTSHVSTGQKITAYGAADPTVPSRLDARFIHIDTASGSGCGGDYGFGDGHGPYDQAWTSWLGHNGSDGAGPSWNWNDNDAGGFGQHW